MHIAFDAAGVIDAVLLQQGEIEQIFDRYGVPYLPPPQETAGQSARTAVQDDAEREHQVSGPR